MLSPLGSPKRTVRSGEQKQMLEGPGILDYRQPSLPLPVSLHLSAFLQDVGV